MKTIEILKKTCKVTFGDLDAGDMFIDADPLFITKEDIMIKLHDDTVTDFVENRPTNAIFISDGTSLNFDNGDEVILVKQVTLED